MEYLGSLRLGILKGHEGGYLGLLAIKVWVFLIDIFTLFTHIYIQRLLYLLKDTWPLQDAAFLPVYRLLLVAIEG